jgi:hypothetical protein
MIQDSQLTFTSCYFDSLGGDTGGIGRSTTDCFMEIYPLTLAATCMTENHVAQNPVIQIPVESKSNSPEWAVVIGDGVESLVLIIVVIQGKTGRIFKKVLFWHNWEMQDNQEQVTCLAHANYAKL